MNTRKQMYRIARRGGRARVTTQPTSRPWTHTAMALIALAAALLLALSACAPAATPAPATTTAAPAATEVPAVTEPAGVGESAEPANLEDFIASLQAADAPVVQGGPVEEPFFGIRAVNVNVNGQDIQVFEFANEADQKAAAATITANGYIIGTTSVDWISQPYFFAKGSVIVVYVGTDPATVQHLTTLLGPALTGPQ